MVTLLPTLNYGTPIIEKILKHTFGVEKNKISLKQPILVSSP